MHNYWDCVRCVCLDDIQEAKAPCIVYSFGISIDIQFESVMTRMGKKAKNNLHF